jgi:hypothetical protein
LLEALKDAHLDEVLAFRAALEAAVLTLPRRVDDGKVALRDVRDCWMRLDANRRGDDVAAMFRCALTRAARRKAKAKATTTTASTTTTSTASAVEAMVAGRALHHATHFSSAAATAADAAAATVAAFDAATLWTIVVAPAPFLQDLCAAVLVKPTLNFDINARAPTRNVDVAHVKHRTAPDRSRPTLRRNSEIGSFYPLDSSTPPLSASSSSSSLESQSQDPPPPVVATVVRTVPLQRAADHGGGNAGGRGNGRGGRGAKVRGAKKKKQRPESASTELRGTMQASTAISI